MAGMWQASGAQVKWPRMWAFQGAGFTGFRV